MSFLTFLTRAWLTRSLRPFHFTNEYDQHLDYADTPDLGIYIHIPFCRSLCDFCPYCKEVYRAETA
jgi:oxygen-independent coproporphyrinogen-3 oxidase